METHGSIDADEAAAALASVRQSRARVAWAGYPAWYWLATGAGMGALSYAALLPGWLGMAVPAVLGAGLVMVARAAGRARGVREGWVCGARTFRDGAALYGPAALLILAGAAALKLAPWSSPWPPVVTAVLIFILIAGTGLARGARAARR